ncbi:MAG: hypothetical protein ACKOJF_09905, partial [Planctomycetaceae bacterium]
HGIGGHGGLRECGRCGASLERGRGGGQCPGSGGKQKATAIERRKSHAVNLREREEVASIQPGLTGGWTQDPFAECIGRIPGGRTLAGTNRPGDPHPATRPVHTRGRGLSGPLSLGAWLVVRNRPSGRGG